MTPTVTAYRITRDTFAGTIGTGVGARDHGGRWNSKGVAVVYAAESRSLGAMEQLVHLVKPRILKGFVVASVTFEARKTKHLDRATLPPGWDDPVAPPALRRFGDDWAAAGVNPVLSVPGAVVTGEWNYLLNPAHPAFAAMPKSLAEPFVFDNRLG